MRRWFLMLCFLWTFAACTESKTAAHVASNQIASALSWVDARAAADFEIRSERKLAELKAQGAGVSEYEAWLEKDGFPETRARIERGFEAHALLISHLDRGNGSKDDLVQCLEDVRLALEIGIAVLESHGVMVPAYVKTATSALPALGGLL